jgi:outer membrane receptor protein involved in Fe transport
VGKTFIRITTLVQLLALSALGQDATGRIVGTVIDPSGAVISGVRITVTNTGTAVSRETTSDSQGAYQVLDLPIGMYRIAAEKSGFAKLVISDQKLLIGQTLRMDLSMTVGSTTETVQVQEVASAIETVSATLGQSVTSRTLVNMPLNGRNVLDLALLQPGVTETNADSAQGGAGRFSVAGGRTDSITYLLDGGVNNHILNNDVVYTPNPDTVAEFRLLTSNYTAEYGRNGSGIVSVVTKTGNNDIHGSLFEFLRNDAFNANTFFNNENGQPVPILKRNQFGATVGGPISIPKLFSGHDRFFFFVGYQGQRLVQTVQNAGVTTFTPAELNGDFSHAVNGGPDTNVASFLRANPFFQANPGLAAQAIIDPTKINPVAQNYIKAGLIPTSPSGLLFPQGGGSNNADELTEKLDFLITSSDHLNVTLGSSRNPVLEPFPAQNNAGPNVPGYSDTNNDRRYFANLAYTRIFSPTLLNEVRFTAQRINHLQAAPVGKKPTPADLGIQITPDNPTGPPLLFFNSGLTVGYSPNGPTTEVDNAYVYSDTFTWIKGKHNMKFGGGYSAYQNNTVYDFYVDGSFTFSGSAGGVASQNDLADFLFGAPDQYLQFGQAPSNIRSKNTSFFAQDEWRFTKNLVLTFGVRYEYSTPKLDTQGRSFSVIPGLQSTRFPNAPPGLLFPGDQGAPKGANFPDKNDFAPRFGFAWDPRGKGKTSIRGGFGVFYDVLKGEDNLQFNGQAPFFGYAFLGFNPVSNATGEITNFRDPFGTAGATNTFPSRPPAKNIDFGASGFLPFGGGGVYFVDPRLRTPYIYQYNLSWQQQLTNTLTSELNYVGSDSHKLTGLVDNNPMLRPSTVRLLNAQQGLSSNDNFGFLDTFENLGTANYNSLEASLQKRLSNTSIGDTYFQLSYTYGHSMDNTSGFRQKYSSQVPYYNLNAFRASSDFDIKHRIAFGGGWDLPFDRMWDSGPKRLTQGWSLYPIVTWRTGFPLDIQPFYTAGSTTNEPGPSGYGDRGIVRANLVGSGITIFDPHTVQAFGGNVGNYWFNPANFSQPQDGQGNYGTLGRNAFRGPDRVNFDIALAKTTNLFGERVKAELRAEFFNILNHAEFDSPNVSNLGSSTFGQITSTTNRVNGTAGDPNSRIIQLALRVTF